MGMTTQPLPTGPSILTTIQLHELGYPTRKIRQLVTQGRLHRIDRGVYCTTPPSAAMVIQALRITRPHLVFTGRTAYQIINRKPLTLPVQALAKRPKSRMSTKWAVIRQVTDAPHISVSGHRVALPVLAVVDLYRQRRMEAIDLIEGYYARREGKALLREHLDRVGRLPREARAFIESRAYGSDSLTERRIFAPLKRRLPGLEQNVFLEGYWWDGVYDKEMVIVEIDGREYHRAEQRGAFVKDRWKRNRVVRAGYIVLTYTAQCVDEHADMIVEQVEDTVRWRRQAENRAARRATPLSWEHLGVWDWHVLWREVRGYTP